MRLPRLSIALAGSSASMRLMISRTFILLFLYPKLLTQTRKACPRASYFEDLAGHGLSAILAFNSSSIAQRRPTVCRIALLEVDQDQPAAMALSRIRCVSHLGEPECKDDVRFRDAGI